MAKVKEVMLAHDMENGDEVNRPHKVKRIKVRQINRAFAAVSGILDGLSENPELEQMIYDMFLGGDEFDPGAYPDANAEELKLIKYEYENKTNSDMAMAVLKSSGFLLVRLPEQIAELASAMSNIDRELLLDQDPDVFADVVKAILEVNDFPALWERGKDLFTQTAAAFRSTKAETTKAGNEPAAKVLQ